MEVPVIGYWQGREFYSVTLALESFTASHWHLIVLQHHIGTCECMRVLKYNIGTREFYSVTLSPDSFTA
jgi:hypothetical protein